MKNSIVILLLVLFDQAVSYAQEFKESRRYEAYHAFQAVAVDRNHFYAIGSSSISKFTMDGDSVTTWHGQDRDNIRHLNSGIIINKKLYCAHSNFPEYPMASSIEIFDTRKMAHIGTVSFGIEYGSCTWILPGRNCWYVFFAHYNRDSTKTKTVPDSSELSQLVQFDRKWRKLQAWTIPDSLLAEVHPSSLSGAVLVGDVFYCTGHDAQKCYLLRIPSGGVSLEWIGEVRVPFAGQGICMDKDGCLWGIIRKQRLVVRADRCSLPDGH